MTTARTGDGPEHALMGVPAAVSALVPEFDLVDMRGESLADCSNCVMLPRAFVVSGVDADADAAVHPWAFSPDTRCCTYHPRLPNYAVGMALKRGGETARVIRERLADPSGTSALGIGPSDRYQAARQAAPLGFGRDRASRCPFWVGGSHTCGVWPERNAVCRTWFCKHGQGMYAMARWTAVRNALRRAETLVAEYLVRVGQAPEPDAGPDGGGTIDTDGWCAWFTWCADALEGLDPDVLVGATAGDPDLAGFRSRLADFVATEEPAEVEVVVPVLRGFEMVAGRLWLFGYSSYDCAGFAPSIIEFFAHLDGRTRWSDALERARDAWPGGVDEVRDLMRIGVLQAPSQVLDRAVGMGMYLPPADPEAAMPEHLTSALGKPIAVADKVWLQGAVPLGSMVAPRAIFAFLSQLDGETTWPEALARMDGAARELVDEALVRRLFAIGGLQPASAES